MRIRTKVFLFSLFFALASGGVMTWCYMNIRREEAAFENSRRAIKTVAAVADLEYFFVRQVRLLESYVLLGDEAERLQLVQASAQTRQRLGDWENGVKKGESHGEELPAVRKVAEAIAVPANNIRRLIALGKKTTAVEMVEKEFSPSSARALTEFEAVKRRVLDEKNRSEMMVFQELQRSHLGLMAGLGLVAFFGMMFIWALFSAVIRPIRNMRAWADRVARGEKKVPMAAFSGDNELTELAQSIGEMVIQLTRPKAYPSPVPAPAARPVSSVPNPLPPAPLPVTQVQSPRPPAIPTPSPGVVTPPMPKPEVLPNPIPVVPPAAIPASPVGPALKENPQKAVPIPTTVTVEGPPQNLPTGNSPKDDFEGAVTEFREILTLMGRKDSSKSR